MTGMSATTGKKISTVEQIRQSVRDILLTPIGSRLMNRDYGSHLFELMDHPGNDSNRLKIYAAVVDAILRWEPRIIPLRVQVDAGDAAAGSIDIRLDGLITVDSADVQPGNTLQVTVPLGMAA